MSLNIKVTNFEGPFDLLLHLIKKNEMDIYNIRIYEITNQYLSFIKEMKEMDLEITSEFIVVAATLLEIKSKMLLPKEKEKNDVEEEDPRKQLIDRLLEYRKFKAAAEFLRQRKNETGVMFAKKAEIIEEKRDVIINEDILKGISMLDLYNLYNELINRYKSKLNTENIIQTQIPLDKYKIEDKMEELTSRLSSGNRLNFSAVVKGCNAKLEVVVTFLALLELIKIRVVKVIQENNFKDIYIERVLSNEQ